MQFVVGKFELAFIVAFEEGRAVWVIVFEVDIVSLRFLSRMATVFAYIDFISPLFVGELIHHAVDLFTMRLQGTSLSESLVTLVAFVGAHT